MIIQYIVVLLLVVPTSFAYKVSVPRFDSLSKASRTSGKTSALSASATLKPQFGSDRYYAGQEVYAPTKIYGFSWKFKNFIVGAMMMVTYPIRLPFRVIARIFRMFFVAKSKSKSKSVAVAPKKVGIEAIESSAESSKASKQSVVLAAVSNENKEAGQALLERAAPMVSDDSKKNKENAQWEEKLKKANAAAAASEERQREAAVQLAMELGYKSSTDRPTSVTATSEAVAASKQTEEDEMGMSMTNFSFNNIFSENFTWESLISGEANERDQIKAAGVSGVASYVITELGFWAISFPIIIASFHASTGEWLNISIDEDRLKILTYSAGFLSIARLAVPLRLGLAVYLQPYVKDWIAAVEDNIPRESA